MIPWRDAQAQIVAAAEALRLRLGRAAERVPLGEAYGRVLAEAALVDRDLPPFDRATRDGYALAAASAAALPATLRVIGEARAGAPFAGEVGPGQAVQIFTGAACPTGADAVVMQEDVARAGDQVTLGRPVATGDWIVATGAEARAGAIGLPAGTRLHVAQLALLAQLGVAEPVCAPRPRVALVSTGDELVDVRAVPGPAQIRDASATALARLVHDAGGEVVLAQRAPDDAAALGAILDAALAAADVVIVTGGVSVGEYDLVEPALRARGLVTFFDAVALRPGKPAVAGRVRDALFLGLPGNPVSSLVTFELFARPALAVLAGAAPRLTLGRARLAVAHAGKPLPLAQLIPCALDGDGAIARALVHQGSGDLFALAQAQAWIVLEPGTGALSAGAEVAILRMA